MPAAKRPPPPEDAGEDCPEVKRSNSVQFEPRSCYGALTCSEPMCLEGVGRNRLQLHVAADDSSSVMVGVRDQGPFQVTLAAAEGRPLPEGVTLHPRGHLVVVPPGHGRAPFLILLTAQHAAESQRYRTWRVVVCVEAVEVFSFLFLLFFAPHFCLFPFQFFSFFSSIPSLVVLWHSGGRCRRGWRSVSE